MTTHGVAPFPLYWPLSQPRTTSRRSGKFATAFVSSRDHLLSNLRLLGAGGIVLSSNVPIRRDGLPGVPEREPQDPGVAVYFLLKERPYVIACDTFYRVTWNLRVLGLTVEALRSIERHGATTLLEQAFSGFAALPPPTVRSWRDVLGVVNGVSLDAAREAYRRLSLERHPDAGGSHELMTELNLAWQQAARELGGAT